MRWIVLVPKGGLAYEVIIRSQITIASSKRGQLLCGLSLESRRS